MIILTYLSKSSNNTYNINAFKYHQNKTSLGYRMQHVLTWMDKNIGMLQCKVSNWNFWGFWFLPLMMLFEVHYTCKSVDANKKYLLTCTTADENMMFVYITYSSCSNDISMSSFNTLQSSFKITSTHSSTQGVSHSRLVHLFIRPFRSSSVHVDSY